MKNAKERPELMTVEEAAKELHRKPETIRAWLARRRLGAYKINRSWFIARSEIERLLTESFIPPRR
jgi:excisionase family DNA binding protein